MAHFAKTFILLSVVPVLVSGCFEPRCWETATCPPIDSGKVEPDAASSASTLHDSGQPDASSSGEPTATAAATASSPQQPDAEPPEDSKDAGTEKPDSTVFIDSSTSATAELQEAGPAPTLDTSLLTPDADSIQDAAGDTSVEPVDPCDGTGHVVCDSVCIDPNTNSDFCGATTDCQSVGEHCTNGDTCAGGECRGWLEAQSAALPGSIAVLSSDGLSGFALWSKAEDHDSNSSTPDITRAYAARWNGTSWSTPARLSNTAGSCNDLVIAAGEGNAVAAWTQYEDTGHAYVAYWNGSAWNTTDLGPGGAPQVAADGNRAIVTWTSDANNLNNSQEVVWAVERTASGWSEPTRISPESNQYTYTPVASIRGENRAIAWLGQTADNTRSIYAVTSIEGTWSAPKLLSTNVLPEAAWGPQVAVGGGTTWFTWAQNADHDASPSTIRINRTHVATWDGSDWSASTRISPELVETEGQRIAADRDHAVLAWVQRDNLGTPSALDTVERLYSANWTNGAWGEPLRLSENRSIVNNTGFEVAYRNRQALVAWTAVDEGVSGSRLHAARWNGAVWPGSIVLSAADQNATLGSISLTTDGTRAWVSWRLSDDTSANGLKLTRFW
jgi:hypothetical protein